jgi:hypothetical protein
MNIRDHPAVTTDTKSRESPKQENGIGNLTTTANGQPAQSEVKQLFKPEEHLDYLC